MKWSLRMVLFGWNRKTEKCITLHLQPLYRLDNSLYHFPDTVSYLLHDCLTQDTFDLWCLLWVAKRKSGCSSLRCLLPVRLLNKKFLHTTDLIIVNVFIWWLVFTTNLIRKAHWVIIFKVSWSNVNHKMSIWTLFKQKKQKPHVR